MRTDRIEALVPSPLYAGERVRVRGSLRLHRAFRKTGPLTPSLSPGYRGKGGRRLPGSTLPAVPRSLTQRRPAAAAGLLVLCLIVGAKIALAGAGAPVPPQPKPVPRMQAVPQPYEQVSLQRDGQEIARYHFGAGLRRPFVFPLIGPAGRSLTRMGHPHDPEGHGHHDSVWVSHNDVAGVSFWDDRATGKIVHRRVVDFEDTDDTTAVITQSEWVNEADGDKVLLRETRRTAARPLDGGEWLLLIDLRLEPAGDTDVTFGKTPFGLVGVRMAKTIGTHDGGGEIRNSEGGVNEAQVLWKRARWVDYSGPITGDATEGMTLMDHPANPNHPTFFHVRGDGWMGTSLTHDAPRTVKKTEPLRLRYGLWVHGGKPTPEQIETRWKAFGETKPAELK